MGAHQKSMNSIFLTYVAESAQPPTSGKTSHDNYI
jgi:hypothetical protein